MTRSVPGMMKSRDRPQRITMKETSVAAWERMRIDRLIVWAMKMLTSAWMRWSGLSVGSPVNWTR
jgi:hypothetical protein